MARYIHILNIFVYKKNKSEEFYRRVHFNYIYMFYTKIHILV